MRNKIWTYLQYGNRFCGIEHTSVSGNNSILVSVLKKSKKELVLESAFQVHSINQVSKSISKNQHAVLVINDENVLSKTIESEQKDPLKLVYKAFPNINLEDFYFEIISESTLRFISICRKDYVDAIIKNYSEHKIHIIDISIGNSLISTLKTFFTKPHVLTSNAKISIHSEQIIEIKKGDVVNEVYDINGLNVSNQEMLSFSAALQTLFKNNDSLTNYKDKSHSLLLNYKQIQFFNQFLKSAGLFILVMLLANFLLFNHYFNKVNELNQISQINESTKQQIVTLDESVSKKQKMVDDLLKGNGSKTSYYTNSIMSSLPETLLISEFNYQPVIKRIKTGKPIELNENSILMSGSSSDSDLFSKWINELEQFDWIKKVDIFDYRATSGSISEFEIKITAKQ